MRGGLDLSRETVRRRPRLRRAAGWLLGAGCGAGLVVALFGWRLPAMAATAPARLADALRTVAVEWIFPSESGQIRALQAQNAALRARVATAAPLEAENAALRQALGCNLAAENRQYLLCRAAGTLGGTLYLSGYLAGPDLTPGTPLLDPNGRFAGLVTGHDIGGSVAALAGQAGCRILCSVGAAGEPGVLTRRSEGLFVTELPRHTAAAAGDTVVTLGGGTAGLWVGQLAEAPTVDPGGLTSAAPLADTAESPVFCYFAIQE